VLHGESDSGGLKLDEIGYWSEIKHDIIKRYATEYSKIMAKQEIIKEYHYIDAFSGPGEHISKTTGEYVIGSPLHALNIEPPFKHFHFIDLDKDKTVHLEKLVGKRKNVTIYPEDCNVVLLEKVFPSVKYEDYKRALCILDPYGLHLDWKVIQTAGHMRSIEIFLNFPVHDINRNLVRDRPESLAPTNIERMDRYWGDHSWYDVLYAQDHDLFGQATRYRVAKTNTALVRSFTKRLKENAGFRFVPEPIPMRNSKRSVVYYLFFASWKATADRIVRFIFDKFRDRGLE
jgi:three-Cys-motif partner protein